MLAYHRVNIGFCADYGSEIFVDPESLAELIENGSRPIEIRRTGRGDPQNLPLGPVPLERDPVLRALGVERQGEGPNLGATVEVSGSVVVEHDRDWKRLVRYEERSHLTGPAGGGGLGSWIGSDTRLSFSFCCPLSCFTENGFPVGVASPVFLNPI